MNMKKTAVAFAVAGLVAAPVASKAEADVYVSIRQDLTFLVSNTADDTLADDEDGVAGKLSLRNSTSRWGFRFTEETDSGTKYFGRYEFSTGTNNGVGLSTRLAYAGFDLGAHQITVGSQWSAWYNYAGNTWGWLDGRYPIQDWTFRHRAVNWLGEFGPVNVTVDLRANEVKTTLFDELQVGASWDFGAVDFVGALRLIQDVADPTAAGGEGAGTVIGLGLNWAISDDFGLQFNMHISDGTNQLESVDAAGDPAGTLGTMSQGYTQLGVLATLPDGFWFGIGIANFDDAKLPVIAADDTVSSSDETVEGKTRITGGWNKAISEHASFFAEVVIDTTEEAHPYGPYGGSGGQGYTNVSAGWIMNF